MAAPTIAITSPLAGSSVGRPFTATGTYTSPAPAVMIVATLKDSSGNVITTVPASSGGGNWTATLNPQQAYTGTTLVAAISGSDEMPKT